MKRPLFMMAGGFVLGEVLGLHDQTAVMVILAAVFTAAFFRSVIKCRNGLLLGLLFFFIFSGYVRADIEKEICEREVSLHLDGVKAETDGKVESIRKKEDRYEVLIRPDDKSLRYLLIYLDGGNLSREKELSIGMTVSVRGKYSLFSSATNPGQFDYGTYYRARKLTYRFFADDIWILNDRLSLYDRYREGLRRLSVYFSGILDAAADPGDSGILRSLLLGDKNGIDQEVRDLYQKNGISHLLAISGLHLSLVSAAVYGILRRTGVGFGLSGLLGGSALLCYCIMSGASVSSLRALIMLLLSYLAALKGRTYDLLTALGLAGFLLFFDSPYQLTQSGPLLSFLAILGIAAASGAGFKGGALGSSLAVQMATAPVILWFFFRFPLYGVIINLFVLPLMGAVVASGAAGMLAGMISLPLGRFFLGLAHWILLWYDRLCRFFGSLPGSSLLLGRPSSISICIYYLALAVFLFFCRNNKDKDGTGGKKRILYLSALLFLLFPLPVKDCNILFMDVGQGDGIVIRSEAGVILVDGGSSSVNDLYGERLLPCLESMAVPQIDHAIVSHAHSDHTSGVYMLLSEESPVRVKNLILSAGGKGNENCRRLAERAREAGTKVYWMEKGDEMDMGKMKISCLYPEDSHGSPDPDPNEHSLVLRIDYGGFSMLTGGDMTVNGESEILKDASSKAFLEGIQVLKVAHHGSSTSSSGPWLDALSPKWAVVSYGRNNSYGHPGEDTMNALFQRDINVYETAKDGAVSLWTNGSRIRWKTFKTRDSA